MDDLETMGVGGRLTPPNPTPTRTPTPTLTPNPPHPQAQPEPNLALWRQVGGGAPQPPPEVTDPEVEP